MDVLNQLLESIPTCISESIITSLLLLKKCQTLKQSYSLDFIRAEPMKELLALNGK